MPLTEDPWLDPRTEDVRAFIEWAKDEFNPYQQLLEEQQAEERAAAEAAAEKAAWRAAHPIGRPPRKRAAARPHQAAGYRTKAEWLADGSPGPMTWTDEE